MSDNLLEDARGKPRCIAVVLCNEVIEDKQTNNKTLVSLFNAIAVPQLPAIHPRLYLFASFAHGVGKWPLIVSLNSPSGKEFLRIEGELDFATALDTQDVVLQLRSVPLLEPGMYRIDIIVGETVVNERRFSVHVIESEGG